MKGTLTIKTSCTEKELIEGALNMASSGYDANIAVSFYALSKSWHINKLIYYLRLIKDAELTRKAKVVKNG